MKKILQISNYYYPNIGGIEQVAHDISDAIAECEDYEQKLICFNETANDGDVVCKRKETSHDLVDGIEIIRCGCFTKIVSQSLSFSFNRELKNIMTSFKPDIVIFHYPNPFQAFFLLKILPLKTKFILYWHLDIVKQKILGKVFGMQTNSLLERADIIVSTSPLYIEGSPFLSRHKEKCLTISNCINENRMKITTTIREKADEIRRNNEGKTICFGVGRHIPYKGFKYLVDASRYLDNRFMIYIGGKGPLTEKLMKEASDDEKIVFLGRLSDDDLKAYYLAMDIFCFPSITKNEAFGIALAEGMYFGKPAVTFYIPGSGVNYVNLKGETGLEVENRNSDAYAKAILKLAEDIELNKRLGQNAKDRVNSLFLSSVFRERIQQLILN